MRNLIILAIAVILCLPAVSAADGLDITQDSVNRTGQQDSGISGSFTVQNNGTTPLNITFSGLTVNKGSDSMSVSLSPGSITDLGAGSSQSISFSLNPAQNQPAGLYTGRVTATGNSVSDGVDLNINVTNNPDTGLDIQEVYVTIHYPEPEGRFSERDDNDDDVLDGETIDADIYPGSEVEFDITVENLFSGSSDIDLDNVLVEIRIEEIDDGDDLEAESSEFDLEGGNEEELEFRFTIPEEVEIGSYETVITVEAEDSETDETYLVERIIQLPVRKATHDLRIISSLVTPSVVSCGDSIRLQATMIHAGKGTENDAGLQVVNTGLGLNHLVENIELEEEPYEEESRFVLDYPFGVPADAEAGTYDITFRALYQSRAEMDSETQELRVTCAEAQEPEEPVQEEPEETEEPSAPTQQPEDQDQEEPSATNETRQPILIGSTSEEKPFFETPVGIAILLIGNLVILIALIALIGKLLVTRAR